MNNKKILVIGESNRDEWVFCSCDRLAPEACVPIAVPVETLTNQGMGGNVVATIRGLGMECDFITNDNWDNIRKTRYLERHLNHMFIRIDSNDNIERIRNLNKIKWSEYSAVCLVDYNKGLLTEDDIEYISKQHSLVTLDSKKKLGSYCHSLKFIKINRREFNLTKDTITPELKDKLIVTLGELGCQYKDKVYPVDKVEIKNLSSAGDQFNASFIVKYVQTNNIEESLIFANKCSTIAVQKKAISPITLEELKLHDLV